MTARALTIAGSDSGGGAGIQADLKTFAAFGVYGSVVLTAVTAQNTTGVQAAFDLPTELIAQQFDSVLGDIGTDAAKTGMLSSIPIVETVAAKVRQWKVPNLVLDPVMVAKGGDPLLAADARQTLIKQLVPLADVLTPNRHETAELTGIEVTSIQQAREAAKRLVDLGPKWVVVKAGTIPGAKEAIDVVGNGRELFELAGGRDVIELAGPRFDTPHTHGSGCAFSAAIAAGLAQGLPVLEAIRKAKAFIGEAIRTAPQIGTGHGPVNHLAGLTSQWARKGGSS